MKKQLLLSLTVALGTQALSPAVFAQSAMTSAITHEAAVEDQQIAQLKNDLNAANDRLIALDAELRAAKANAPKAYKNGVIIRNTSLLAAAGGLVALGVSFTNLKRIDPQWETYLGESVISALVAAAGAVGTVTGETMVKLNDQQVVVVESRIRTAHLEIRAIQHRLEEIK